MGWDGRITRIRVWTSTVGTSLVQEAKFEFPGGSAGSWVVYTQTKTKQMQSKLCKGLGTSPIKDLQPIPQISNSMI